MAWSIRKSASSEAAPRLVAATPEELGRQRRQPCRRAQLQDRRNERVVEHDLLVGAAFDDPCQRNAGIGLRHLALR
jgi:hypothetical protein